MKKNIAILMGGYSSENEISIKSGNVVYQNLDTTKYNLFRIFILKNKWVFINENKEEFTVDKNDFSVTINRNKIKFDCVFNAIHGSPGENGIILAYLEMLGIKHTSSPYYQMALTFNKRDTLSVLKEYGVKTAKSYYLNKGDKIDIYSITDKVKLPCFVKPNNAGSSFGISKVNKQEDLLNAIHKAFNEDDEILIESFLDGTEVSVGVLNYNDEIIVLPITEIVSENDFFDYEAKYLGKSQEITPARISKKQKQHIIKQAKLIYSTLRMQGFSRSEFILIEDEPYFLEINTVPGLTNESILPKQANKQGISLTQLFGNAIEMALKN